MDHSYEEIRAAALDILAEREKTYYEPTQYGHIERGVAEVLAKRDDSVSLDRRGEAYLSPTDAGLFMEVFWDLFRQGIITLGYNENNLEFPHCRLSHFGKRILGNQDTYFFHDVSPYTDRIHQNIPKINPITLVYLQEAMQAFRAGCMLSSSVMLGVAAEHTFDLLMEGIAQHQAYCRTFGAVTRERMLLTRMNKFRDILGQHFQDLPREVKEDLDTNFAGILAIIRTFRNESGHPTGKIIDREQMYILLNLFIPYCKKMYQLMEHYSK